MNSSVTVRALLALDIDGVFHPEGCPRDQEWMHLEPFQEAMRRVPDVAIVISSMWRYEHDLEDLRGFFAPDIAERIIGLTPDLFDPDRRHQRGLRQREIEAWVDEHARGAAWLALDDRKEYFDEDCPHLLYVRHVAEGGVGLQPEHLQELVDRLRDIVVGSIPGRWRESEP